MNAGRLIAFEGLDGSGKSTQVELLAEALRRAGRSVLVTREPSEGPAGRRIRELARSNAPVAADEELRGFVEDRRDHVARVITPGLREGQVVVTDRYTLSSVAYQGARGLDPAAILAESEAEFPVPDLVLLLEIEPGPALERVRSRAEAVEALFERRDFLERVAEILASLDLPYLERIDARSTAEEVHRAVLERVRSRLGLP
ncbi:MAG: dTMP kinase [Myxococcota bacterium]